MERINEVCTKYGFGEIKDSLMAKAELTEAFKQKFAELEREKIETAT